MLEQQRETGGGIRDSCHELGTENVVRTGTITGQKLPQLSAGTRAGPEMEIRFLSKLHMVKTYKL